MTPSIPGIHQCLFQVTHAAAAALPPIALHPEERMSCAGSAFHEAPLLVEAVCAAVAESPALFPGVPMDPAAVLSGQERARLFLSLSAVFQRLARRAHDAYLFEQSQATTQVMAVVRYGRLQLASPYDKTDGHRRLSDALRPAEEILASRPSVKGKRQKPRRRLGLFSSSEFLPHVFAPRQKKTRPRLPGSRPRLILL